MNIDTLRHQQIHHQQTLEKPMERPLIMRTLDRPGYVPIIGRIVGIIRVISSLAGCCITELGAELARALNSNKWHAKLQFTSLYLYHELERGILEIKGLSCLFDARRREQEGKGILGSKGASGKYIYENKGLNCIEENEVYSWAGHVVYSNTNYEGKNIFWNARKKFTNNGQNICKIYQKLTPSQTNRLFNLFLDYSTTGNGLFLTPRDMDRLYDALPKSDQVTQKQKLLDWCCGARTTVQHLIGSSPFPLQQKDVISKLPGNLAIFIEGLNEAQAGMILQQLRQLMDPHAHSGSGALREDPKRIFFNSVQGAVGGENEMTKAQNLIMCRFLLAAGSTCHAVAKGLRTKDASGKTALMHAVKMGRIDIVQALLHAATPETKAFLLTNRSYYGEGRTAFRKAMFSANIAMMQTLLDAAADQRARDRLLIDRDFNGRTSVTSLLNATVDGINPRVLQFLLSKVETTEAKRVLLMSRDRSGNTALMRAACIGDLRMINILLNAAVGPELREPLLTYRDELLQTAWIFAVSRGNIEVLQTLWNATAPENRAALLTDRNRGGMTPLMHARTTMVVQFLLDRAGSPEAQAALLADEDNSGRTALMYVDNLTAQGV